MKYMVKFVTTIKFGEKYLKNKHFINIRSFEGRSELVILEDIR